MTHEISVKVVNGKHQCQPTQIEVNGGDLVVWGNGEPIFYPDSPFEEGQGPFKPGEVSKVKKGLPKGKTFAGKGVEGQIIVKNP